MNYYVTDNRKVIEAFFFEQDSTGKLHIYDRSTMEYLDCLDYVGVFPYDVFIDKCKEWLYQK